MTPPVLHTARLVLRAHQAADFEDVAAVWADPAVVASLGMPPSSSRESWQRLLRYGGLWPLLGYGYWAVREAASGRFVGDVGFADFHREIAPSIRGTPEAGWVLARWAWGQGFAGEAMAGALAWLDAQGRPSVCLIGPDNTPSLRLAARLGYGDAIEAALAGGPVLLLARSGKARGRAPGLALLPLQNR